MSRRDTIIVAVLVNAALLMILFATAVRSDKPLPQKESPAQLAKAPAVEEDLFEQYITSIPTLSKEAEESLSFAEEIELAFNTPEPLEVKKPLELPKSDGKFVDVTVKKGDFLEKIANANNTSVAAIMEANKITSTQLKIGQVLKIPLSDTKPKKTTPAAPSTPEGEFYVVKEGDSPWLIASRNKIRLEELLRLNGLDDQKARRLRPGDRLRIR